MQINLSPSLNGWKTYAGIFGYALTVVASYADKINSAQADVASKLSWAMIGLGLVHKFVKAFPAAK